MYQRACILGLVHPRSGLFAKTSLLCLCEITLCLLSVLSFGVVSSPALDLNWRETCTYQVFCQVRTHLGFRYSAVPLDEVASLLPVVAWDKLLHLGYLFCIFTALFDTLS